jgi:hypothetical protein
MLPTHILHADWGTNPKKRWAAKAVLQSRGRYVAFAPEPVGAVADLIPGIRSEIGERGCALLGFDFPIGVPTLYARQAGIRNFRELLPQLGRGDWSEFFEVANKPSDIRLRRPFYPFNQGGKRQVHLLTALGASLMDDLRRRCELKQANRNAACPLFWTLGANQVGKGAIIGWRDMLIPAVQVSDAVVLWPFDGPLQMLLQEGRVVIAETYPAECCGWFLKKPLRGKGERENRKRVGAELLRWALEGGVEIDCQLKLAIDDGFPQGDDPFDAVVGLFGMLEVVLGKREPGEPKDEHIRNVEGWILGQAAGP